MPHSRIISRLVLLTMSIALTGCDSFFWTRGGVVDRTTGLPIQDANVKLILDEGASEPDHNVKTGADGKLNLLMNEHESAWATLTVEHPGYFPWSAQFKGSPKNEIVVKLIPVERTTVTRLRQ